MPRSRERLIKDIIKLLTDKQKQIRKAKQKIKTTDFDFVPIALLRDIEARIKINVSNLENLNKLLEDL